MTKPVYKRIFIVEDNEIFREALKAKLTHHKNLIIHGYKSAGECLDNLYLNPDYIILDYYLDSTDESNNGLNLLKEIKDKNPDVEVIMLSQQEKYGVAARTIYEGASHYIIKDEEAFDKIEELLE